MNKTLEPVVRNSEFSKSTERRTLEKRAASGESSSGIAMAKEELLNDLDSEQKRPKNISLHSLLWVYILLLFVLLFTLPKIYIANQIYYISKDINAKYHKYTALLEENRHLKKRIEQLNYERNVLDSVEMP